MVRAPPAAAVHRRGAGGGGRQPRPPRACRKTTLAARCGRRRAGQPRHPPPRPAATHGRRSWPTRAPRGHSPPLLPPHGPDTGCAADRRSLPPPTSSCATSAPCSPEHGSACAHLQVPVALHTCVFTCGLDESYYHQSRGPRPAARGSNAGPISSTVSREGESFRDAPGCHPSDRAPSKRGTAGRSTPVTAVPPRRR